MKKIVCVVAIAMGLSACDFMRLAPQLKCINGDVYVRMDGAWVEAMFYEKNKCAEESK